MYYTLQDIQKEIKKDIGKNRLRKALEKLDNWLLPDSGYVNEVVQQSSSFYALEQEERTGSIARAEQVLRRSQLRKALLELIDTLTEDDFSQEAIMQEGIHDHFLVLYQEAEGQKKIQRYFNKIYFSHVDYQFYKECPKGEKLKEYSFILFDFMHGHNTDLHYLMEDILREEEIPVLYFGRKRSSIIDKEMYVEKAQAANSVFALYARIKEILDYQKYFQVDNPHLS